MRSAVWLFILSATLMSVSGVAFAQESPSSPPISTDDPNPAGLGEFENNMITEVRPGMITFIFDSNWGAKLPFIGDVQLTVGISHTWLKEHGGHDFEGVEFRVKKKLLDNGKVAIAVFPAFALPATSGARDKGIGERIVVKIPLLVSEKLSKHWVAVQNVGYEYHQDAPNLATVNAGLAYIVKDGFALMGDSYVETDAGKPWSGDKNRGVDFGFTHPIVKDRLNLMGSVGYEWTPQGNSPKTTVTLQWNGRYRKKSNAELDAEARQEELAAREEKLARARARQLARNVPKL